MRDGVVGIGRRSATLAAAAAAVALLAGASSAQAAIDLPYRGCISGETQAAAACALIPGATSFGAGTGLELLQGIAASPDGRSVYAASESDHAIARFSRDPVSGALTYVDCVSGDTATTGCTPITSATPSANNSGMEGLRALAMSPDGAHLYAVARFDDSILHFPRDMSTGALSFGGCLTGDSDVSEPPCGAVGGSNSGGNNSGFNEPYDLVVTQDEMYVVSQEDDSIVRLGRQAGAGSISYSTGDCLTAEVATGPASGGGTGACAASPTITAGGGNSGLDKPRSVAISPDGTSVYTAAPQDDAVARFDRVAGGGLNYVDCVTGEDQTGPMGSNACSALASTPGATDFGGQSGIDNPQSIAVSPDNASLYLASGNDASIAHFDRAVGGALTYQGCITGEIQSGPSPGGNNACAAAPVMTSTAGQPGGADSGFDNMRDVVVSPDGASVYAAAGSDAAVVRYSRAPGGAIAFAGCTTGQTEVGLCTPIGSAQTGTNGGESGLAFPQALAATPDGKSLYYIATNDQAVGTFSADVPPEPPPAEGDTSAPDTTITDGPKRKTKKKQAEFAFSGADARAVAGFECRVDDDAFAPCASPFEDKVKKGKHHFEVRAIDGAGNVDPTPATYDWKVKKKKKKKK